MASFPSKGTSFWVESTPETNYAPLTKDTDVDIAIIGGGIAGLSTAYLLKQRGKRVAVIEKQRVGEGVSGFTTGKVTSQHGKTYTSYIKDFGKETARIYGEANEAAIERIEQIIKKESIDCDWQRRDNYVFTEKPDEVDSLKQEAKDAASLGLPATFEPTTPLPFAVAGAVKFSNQATFHVRKYLQGLARAIHGDGSYVFEKTKASHFREGTPCTFRTPGGKVTARDIVYATNVPTPVVEHTAYGLLEYPARSYIVAGKLDHDIEGMHINTGNPTRSILPITIGGEPWLLVGGEGHFVGLSGPARGRYKKLREYAKEQFRLTNIEYEWSTWDYVAYDRLPLIGKVYPFSKHTFVATGFRKWGLTNGTVAGMILTDLLTGTKNPWAHTFRSDRLSAVTSLPKGTIRGILSG